MTSCVDRVEQWIDNLEKFMLVEPEMHNVDVISSLGLEHKFLMIYTIDNDVRLLSSKLEFNNLSTMAKQILFDLVYNKHRCLKCGLNIGGRGRIGERKILQEKIIKYMHKRFGSKRSEGKKVVVELCSFVSNLPVGSLFKIIS